MVVAVSESVCFSACVVSSVGTIAPVIPKETGAPIKPTVAHLIHLPFAVLLFLLVNIKAPGLRRAPSGPPVKSPTTEAAIYYFGLLLTMIFPS